jgi:hypothetical protein
MATATAYGDLIAVTTACAKSDAASGETVLRRHPLCPAIMVAAWYGGFGPDLLSTALSGFRTPVALLGFVDAGAQCRAD